MCNLSNGGDDRFASHLSCIMHSIIGQTLHTHTHTVTDGDGGRVVLGFSDKVNFMHRVHDI